MKINCVKVGMLQTNCYILNKDGEVLIIDPGAEFDKIKDNISGNVVGILLTHSHFDHIGALEDCVNYYNVKKYDKNNLVSGINKISNFEFIVNYNFGHTMDSISFLFDDLMFSGDFIFESAIGRTDIGGDMNCMRESIKDILSSKIDYKIYPGHGDTTTLFKEKAMLNNYLK